MPGRKGYQTVGGWAGASSSGGASLPQSLTLDNRTGGDPLEYKASYEIDFVPDFSSASVDNFEAYITQGDNGSGGEGGTIYGTGAYRYGFNGKENDDEVKGEGAQQDYGMRIYDPRLGRFLSVDPLTQEYPFYTSYQFAGNMPIYALDLDGAEELPYLDQYKYDGSWGIFDRLKAIPNTAGRIYNHALAGTWNSGVSNVRSLSNGTWTKDMSRELKQMGSTIKKEAAATYKYHSKTSAGQQVQDFGNFLLDPKRAEDALEFGFDMYTGSKFLNAKGNLLTPVKSVPNIALGLDAIQVNGKWTRTLRNFSDKTLSLNHKQWDLAFGDIATGKSFGEIFSKVTRHVIDRGGIIKFDITGLDMKRVVSDIGTTFETASSYTNAEFLHILRDKKLLNGTRFYENGNVLSTKDVIGKFKKAGGKTD